MTHQDLSGHRPEDSDDDEDSLPVLLGADLDDDLDETVTVDAVTATPNATDFADPLDDLDALLEESMGTVKQEAAARAARERLKRGGQSAAERLEDAARIREWEDRNEWRTVANAAVFVQYECACGSLHSVFGGLFAEQDHRHLRQAKRWAAIAQAKADLPNHTFIRAVATPVCYDCAGEKGWSFGNATVWEG